MNAPHIARSIVWPKFLETREVNISFDTTGFCQARCASCVWVELPRSGRVMSLDEFKTILARFDAFHFSEICFNSINEPFTDKGILDKIEHFVAAGPNARTLFFSSNWLNVTPSQVERFVQVIERALREGRVKNVCLNATICGVDQDSYDILQAGRDLENSVHRYRRLDFESAKNTVLVLTKSLQRLRGLPFVLYLKGYGDIITDEAYRAFWTGAAREADIAPDFFATHVRAVMNHGFTSFARSEASSGARRKCATGFLTDKIVIGHDGQLGLCCQESARVETFGSLIDQPIEAIARSDKFQDALAIVTGQKDPAPGMICNRCEHFQPE